TALLHHNSNHRRITAENRQNHRRDHARYVPSRLPVPRLSYPPPGVATESGPRFHDEPARPSLPPTARQVFCLGEARSIFPVDPSLDPALPARQSWQPTSNDTLRGSRTRRRFKLHPRVLHQHALA
ncbi:hypothetical protein BHE74_00058405, partial [Ensete ventricosum]